MSPFKEWESFYVIVGSSAAALTGLQFVVMALIADRQPPSTTRAIDAFGTPNVVHFSVALLVSAILTAPWRTTLGLVSLLAIVGATGVIYSIVVARRARQQTEYKPVFEDWAFHVLLPAAAYGVMAAAAYVLRTDPSAGLFALGAAVLLLLFIGIHNTWDSVVFIIFVRRRDNAGD
jgi:hypothetical protein